MNPSCVIASSGGINSEDLFLEASDIVEDRCRNSQTMDIEAFNSIPRFETGEIQLGKVLGKGGFCTVSEIKQVMLLNQPAPKPIPKRRPEGRDEHDDDDDFPGGFASYVVQDRNYMATRYLRHGKDARYAIKALSPETLLHPDKYLAGIVDLAIEAKFLSCIRHPNIIKMRAMTSSGPFSPGFFLVLDRLYDILPERLKQWSNKRKSLKGVGKLLDLSKSKKKKLTLERLLVCMDLSSALAYLHSHNIVYRDLKPDNIGFDVRGDVKLFDFGLSFEITEDRVSLDGLYELSGNTGSMRYMAPEVALGNPYNHKVDVYSYGILFWQIMALKTPFEGHSVSIHRNEVIMGSKRPLLEGSVWTQKLSRMTSCCWSADIQERPEFADILSVIRNEASTLEAEESAHDSAHSSVFDRSRHTERSL